jgi:hypothetical protein
MEREAEMTGSRNPIAALRRMARPRTVHERCDLCSAPIAEGHQHLLELKNRQLSCACDACAVLFSDAQHQKYRRVPRRIEHWTDFQIADEQWEALGVPIALAFFFYSTQREQMLSVYPSPGGGTEATLAGEVWDILCQDNPRLAKLEPDVEALLVNRIRGKREYFLVPIDQCFMLVGLIRTHWRGLSGGSALWQEIEHYFEQLKKRSAGVNAHA